MQRTKSALTASALVVFWVCTEMIHHSPRHFEERFQSEIPSKSLEASSIGTKWEFDSVHWLRSRPWGFYRVWPWCKLSSWNKAPKWKSTQIQTKEILGQSPKNTIIVNYVTSVKFQTTRPLCHCSVEDTMFFPDITSAFVHPNSLVTFEGDVHHCPPTFSRGKTLLIDHSQI